MSGESARGQPDGRDPDDGSGEPGPGAELAELAALGRVSSLQSLSPIPDDVAQEIRDFAETLRVLFGALGMSLNRLAALLHSDPGTVSRYLSGRRIPPPNFIDGLCKAVYDVKGSLITAQVQELVHEQFLVALREHNPPRYEVQRLTDLLQVAAQERRQYEITVAALEEAIASRNDKIYTVQLETRQLRSAWARTEGLLEEGRKHRERLQQTIDSLYTQVSYFKEQLLSVQRRATEAEDRCRELEARLDAAGALLQDDDQQTAAVQVTSGPPEAPATPTLQPRTLTSDGAAPPETIHDPDRELRPLTRSQHVGHAVAEVIRAGDVTLDARRLVANIGQGPVPLTRLEFLLLRELVEHAGELMSKDKLLASVWGYDFDPGSNVVDVCVRRLRSKLGFDLIKTVRGEGYQLVAR